MVIGLRWKESGNAPKATPRTPAVLADKCENNKEEKCQIEGRSSDTAPHDETRDGTKNEK
jgi:hypothetical protein